MVSFELTEEQLAWQKKARDFAESEIKSLALKLDRNPDPRQGFSWDTIKKLASNGFMTLHIPEEYGGTGLDVMTTAIVLEELAAGDVGIAFTAGTGSVQLIQLVGTEEQKRKFLPLVCDREQPKLTVFGLTEPGAGSDAASILTTAIQEGNEYVLNGTKCFTSNGGIAGLYIIFASTDKTKGTRGISAFIIPGETAGISGGKVEDKMGFRGLRVAEVILNNVRVPKQNLLGEEGGGFILAMKNLDLVRPLFVGALGVGLARAAYESALNFARQRFQFDKAAFHNQIISFKLVDMATMIEAVRLLVWKTCWLIDNNMPFSTESAMTKFLASDLAMKVATEAAQIVGLNGYTEEYPVEKYVRDAKVLQIFEGTNQIQRTTVARRLIAG